MLYRISWFPLDVLLGIYMQTLLQGTELLHGPNSTLVLYSGAIYSVGNIIIVNIAWILEECELAKPIIILTLKLRDRSHIT